MADLTYEILTDRQKYPDEMTITISGQEVPIGEFRKQYLPKADFTRASEGWSREKKELGNAYAGLQGQFAKAQKELEDAIRWRQENESRLAPPPKPEGLSDEDYLRDPVLAGPYKMLVSLRDEMNAAKKELEALNARTKRHEETWIANAYETQLGNIKNYWDSRFNTEDRRKAGKAKEFDRGGFLKHVQDHSIVDLNAGYRSWAWQDELALETELAEQRGVERGRAERVPVIPNGGRRSTQPRDPSLPADFSQVTTEHALADPDIQRAMRGEDAA